MLIESADSEATVLGNFRVAAIPTEQVAERCEKLSGHTSVNPTTPISYSFRRASDDQVAQQQVK